MVIQSEKSKQFIFFLPEEHRLNTCNRQGPFGPTMEDCAKVYKYYKTKVQIGIKEDNISDNQDHFAPIGFTTGIQRWIAPSTGIYT